MFFCVMTDRNIKAGEVTVLKYNNRGELACYLIDGTFVGYVSAKQPDGCLSFWEIASSAGGRKILCNVAIRAGRVLIMKSDSKAFERRKVRRVEVEGYGMMVSV
ncbi:MAG TPA: hypothetical protein H9690_05165 [Firmicutes bacterium]|nr:hypothetical protein [Bacillota bacterium]